jgi:hypothetical protein
VWRWILVLVLLVGVVLSASRSTAKSTQQTQQRDELERFCGLYYLEGDDLFQMALVISPDGKPVPRPFNDPDAPSRPGFHVGKKYFPFANSEFSHKKFLFETTAISGIKYSFQGEFGYDHMEGFDPPDVPYLRGVLVERRNGRVVSRKQVKFGHAVAE